MDKKEKEDKKINNDNKKQQKKEEDLSEADLQLKEKINFKVDRICAQEEKHRLKHLQDLFNMITTTQKSRTAIPKEIKFLKPLYPNLIVLFEKSEGELKKNLADFLSFTSISLEENYDRHSFHYLKKGTQTMDLKNLGQEFVLNLSGDLGLDYESRYNNNETNFDDIYKVAGNLLPILFQNGDDISAIDLLLDIEQLEKLHEYINKNNYLRVFNYLVSSVEYSSDNVEFEAILSFLFKSSLSQEDYANALRVSIRLNNLDNIKIIFEKVKDPLMKKQLCFALGRHRLIIDSIKDEKLIDIMSNRQLSRLYMDLVKDLDVLEPKKPREIYKEMLGEKEQKIDSALLNLADSFVNGFVNIGTGKETLMDFKDGETNIWIQRVKNKGIMSTVASLGLIHFWNFEEFSFKLADYLDLKDGYAKAGAFIALGLCTSGVWDESDPAQAILMEGMESDNNEMKLGASIGLGLAYATSQREEFKEILSLLMNDENLPTEVSVCAALSQSLIFVSECDEDVINTILSTLMMFSKETLDQKMQLFLGVALAITFLGRQDKCEAVLEALESIEHPVAKLAQTIVESVAYIGTGNVLLIQKYMQRATKHFEEKKDETEEDKKKRQNEIDEICLGLIGVALLSVSEIVGQQMIIRNIHHILQYCDPCIKRVVPIMLTIAGIHNFNIQTTDLLYKLSHDEDKETALRSLLGLGLIAAGSNNSRIGGLLRNLGIYYENENDYLYIIRISLGLLYSGKGLVGINQFYSDRFLYNKTGFAGLLILIYSMMNVEEFLIKNNHYLFYYFSLALYPKMLFLLDENLVGQAIDTVAQVGKPRRITGFQTHSSPVVINNGERAELGAEEYITVGESVLENVIIVKKNPNFNPDGNKRTN